MLDEYFYQYEEIQIETTFEQKSWPSTIIMDIQDGNANISQCEESFSQRLDMEKDDFARALQEYQAMFEKIKTFNSYNQINEYAKEASDLRNKIDGGHDKVTNFKERELLFGQSPSEYPKLDELQAEFEPFAQLLDTAFQVQMDLQEFLNNPLITQDY